MLIRSERFFFVGGELVEKKLTLIFRDSSSVEYEL